ncbi:hypothetical protein L7F22_059007 [Adiantum nelumboides]|nr:hypothetical protein [Adiantum nelumboides]
MYPPRRPPQRVQFDVPQQPPTILRRPPPPPQPMAAVPPVPDQPEEREVNIIKLEEPEELNVMPAIKRIRVQERDEEMKSDTSDEPKKGKKKVKEDEAESSKKKKSRRPRRVIGIDDFPLGLSITEPSDCHAKLANKSKVKCLGIIKDVYITVLDVFAKVDFYVMPSKGEGYPLILGRPWLMEVNADQKWGSGKLVLQKSKRIVYDMKLGKQSNICFETSTDEESSDESSYGDEESYTSEESSMEVMGLVFQQPQAKGSSTSKEIEVVAKEEPMMKERLRKMLSKDLTKEEEEDYINMFKRYPHLFIPDYSMIKGVDVIQHHIDLKPDAKPVTQKLRRLGVVQQEALLTEVNKLLKAGFIYPVTNSKWVSPVVVTPKKNGKWRVCVDYKPLNAATKRDHFPLPFQDEILNEVAGHERYTICDGYSGYYQIRIAEEDQHKTTFITPWGCFAFRVMPFGLTNAPSTFTRFTSFIFQPFFGKSIRVFLDDFCTYSDRALHCQRVEKGLQRLYQYGGQLNPDKCHVAEKEVVLLGHVISQEGIKVDPSRVQAILDLPPPNSARQVITFVQKVQGTWACKNSKLLQWLHEVKLLMKNFEAIQIQHISCQHNKEADNMANSQFEVMVGAIKFKEPLFRGQETMEDILYFLETGECPKHLERVQRHCLVRKALSYQLIGEHLYHKGKDLVLRRVSLVKEIEKILMSCHDGVCGGHFAQEIASKKILQAGFVWPSLHRDVQHWCKACKACQQAGDHKLSYGPRFQIFAYDPFEKWGIDAIGPLPRTSTDKQYILTATDYMTRWAEAASVARITAADVNKFVLDYICSRFGTPLEILSDRGPGFRADLLDALLENLSIKHVHSTPYYPQCNGLVEKTNGVLCKIITKHVRDGPQDWDKHLTAALWAYRTSFKVSTQFMPYHLVYVQEALLPIEVELGSLRVLARETTSSKEKLEQRILDLQRLELDREAASDYYITQANKKREQFNNKVKEKKLEEGMLVMRYDSRHQYHPLCFAATLMKKDICAKVGCNEHISKVAKTWAHKGHVQKKYKVKEEYTDNHAVDKHSKVGHIFDEEMEDGGKCCDVEMYEATTHSFQGMSNEVQSDKLDEDKDTTTGAHEGVNERREDPDHEKVEVDDENLLPKNKDGDKDPIIEDPKVDTSGNKVSKEEDPKVDTGVRKELLEECLPADEEVNKSQFLGDKDPPIGVDVNKHTPSDDDAPLVEMFCIKKKLSQVGVPKTRACKM